jgi:hypothetical protein
MIFETIYIDTFSGAFVAGQEIQIVDTRAFGFQPPGAPTVDRKAFVLEQRMTPGIAGESLSPY